MKKIKWLVTVLVVASIVLGVIGCDNPSGPSGSGNGGAQQGGANGGNSGEQTGGGTQGVVVPEMVLVEGGTVTGAAYDDYFEGVFIEGRTVTLSDFYMGKYEVTQEEYASVMAGQKVTVDGTEYTLESNPNYCTEDSTSYTLFTGDEQGKRPVEGVTWYDAVWYCNALSEKEGLTKAYNIEVTQVSQASGKTGYYISAATVTLNANPTGYRLPTEAEWEYAARGGDPEAADWNYVFSGADTAEGVSYNDYQNCGLDSVGWYCYNNITGTTGDSDVTNDVSGSGTHQVGKKAANRLGLYDMSGNVWELCYDFSSTVNTGEESNPTGAASGSYRVGRGGSWDGIAYGASVWTRGHGIPYDRYDFLGFRVVRFEDPEIHVHTFAEAWTSDSSGHWHAATCEHTDEISGFAEHSYGTWNVVQAPTTTQEGKIERACSGCGYTDPVVLQPAPEGFRFVKGVTITGEESWTPSSEVFVRGRSLTIPDLIVSDHEVTRDEYKAVMGSDPSTASAYDKDGNELEGDAVLNTPVNNVNWYDAIVYCNKLSIKENLTPCYSIDGSKDPAAWGEVPTWESNTTWDAATCDFEADGYRLPTEAEWEWLARGGEIYIYAGSDNVDDVAWYTSNTNDTGTREVKTKAPNGYGLYDMSGNVYEWCWDWYGSISDSSAADGATSGDYRVRRGGCWWYGDVSCWVAGRYEYDLPCFRIYSYGFRVVRSAN